MAVGSSREKAAGKLSRLLGRACWRQGIAPIGCLCLCCALPKTRSAPSRASPAQNRFLTTSSSVSSTRRATGRHRLGLASADAFLSPKATWSSFIATAATSKTSPAPSPEPTPSASEPPTIQRSVRAEDGYFECIQARVHGPTLMDIWPHLGIVSSFRLAFQLRSMVGWMRTLTRPTAGSLGTGICRSIWLEEYYGVPPHAPASTISAIINFWHNLVSFRKEASKTREQHEETCAGPVSSKDDLVFTHHDLAPRNIIGEDGTGLPWLVDWDEAGYYPRYFEQVGMRNFRFPVSWGWFAKLRWKVFTWIATGWRWYGKEKDMLHEVRRKAGRFPAARRFNIKAGVTPSVRAVKD